MNHALSTSVASGEGNRQVWLKARPNGIPRAEDFDIRVAAIPTPADGEFLVRNRYLSVDPAMRGWIADSSTYWPRVEVGETMRAFSVGEVVASQNADYAVGDRVMGIFGWQTTQSSSRSRSCARYRRTTCRCRSRSVSWG